VTGANGHVDEMDRATFHWLLEHGIEGAHKTGVPLRAATWLYNQGTPLQQAYRLCAQIAARSRPPFDSGTMYRVVDSAYRVNGYGPGVTPRQAAANRAGQTTEEQPDDVFAAATQTVQDFMQSTEQVEEFLVSDYIAVGGITSLSARVKLGKTELAMHLVEAVASGVAIFNKAVKQAKVLYLTEQASSVRAAIKRVGLEENRDVWVTPWHKVMKLSWEDIVASAIRFCEAHGIKLLVVDTLSRFARIKDENDSAEAMRVMAPLHAAIAAVNLAILTIRHDRKSGGDLSDSARGSSAYNGEADILLGVRVLAKKGSTKGKQPDGLSDDDEDDVGAHGKDRRRLLVVTSRYGEPDDLLVELTADNEYIVLGQPQRVRTEADEQALLRCIPLGRDQAKKWTEVQTASGLSVRHAKVVLEALLASGRACRDVIDPRSRAIGVWQPPTAHVNGSARDGVANA
jgi:hypothetical protein